MLSHQPILLLSTLVTCLRGKSDAEKEAKTRLATKHDHRKPFNDEAALEKGTLSRAGAFLSSVAGKTAQTVSMSRVDAPEITLTVRSICINNTAKPSSTLPLAFFDPAARTLERVARREGSFIRTLTLPLPAAFHA